jgi:hypothetical protein
MMKRLILAAAATAALSTPAFAQTSSTDEIDLGANVPIECYIDGLPTNVSFGNLSRTGQAPAVVFTGIEVFCNQRSTVTATSDEGYLEANVNNPANAAISETNFQSQANPGFAAGLDYSVTVPNFAGYGGPFSADTSVLTAGVPASLSNLPALNDPSVNLRFRTIPGSLPLLGTTYNDELTITIQATGV